MPLKPGNYYIIGGIIDNVFVFLRGENWDLWSRTLREAVFFFSETEAEKAHKHARRTFSKDVVRNMKVIALDIFGSAKNHLVEIK